jgi:hypothetical protein
MKRLSDFHVPPARRFGASVSCLLDGARERRAPPPDGKPCQVPILKCRFEGTQTSMAANTDGDFIVLALLPSGLGWILAIGTDLKPTHPDDCFVKQATQ